MSWRVLRGDCVERMRELDDESIEAVVTDPPYGLSQEPNAAEVLRHWLAGDDYEHRGGGFMGRSWDSFVPGPAVWCEALRVLKPGGHLLAFFGTRTYDLGVIAIRLAGFEIRDEIAWLAGSGFPKSLDVSKAIDRAAPRHAMFEPFAQHYAERRRAKGLTHAAVCAAVGAHGEVNHGGASVNWERGYGVPTLTQWKTLAPLLGLVDTWLPLIERVEAEREKLGERDGSRLAVAPGQDNDRSATSIDVTAPATPEAERWQGWGTALKPAHEPVVVARKPLAGTVAGNVLEHGTGALNVDGCRIEGAPPSVPQPAFNSPTGQVYGFQTGEGRSGEMSDASGRWPANVVLDPEAARMLDEQTGELTSGKEAAGGHRRNQDADRNVYGSFEGEEVAGVLYGDSGGASRFFYCAKASRAERNAGLEGFEEKALHWSSGDQNPGSFQAEGTHKAARNPHPTVKPIALMRWLCRLVAPPGGTVLDPFTGSGTTGCAAVLEGFDFLGIEREHEYAAIAEARIGWWHKHRGSGEVDEILAAGEARDELAAQGQVSMFDLLDGEAA